MLIDDVRTAIGSQRLIELTNANDAQSANPAENTSRLTLAVTHTESEFRTHSGVVYDNTDSRHSALGVRGVVIRLQMWSEMTDLADAAHKQWLADVSKLGRQVNRGHIQPRVHTDHLAYPDRSTRKTVGDPRILDSAILDPPTVD